MSEISFLDAQTATPARATPAGAKTAEPCGECLGTGGWYRYEPALEDSPGMLYLSCVGCRGSGRPSLASA